MIYSNIIHWTGFNRTFEVDPAKNSYLGISKKLGVASCITQNLPNHFFLAVLFIFNQWKSWVKPNQNCYWTKKMLFTTPIVKPNIIWLWVFEDVFHPFARSIFTAILQSTIIYMHTKRIWNKMLLGRLLSIKRVVTKS